jgi:hypothetical protein
MERKEMVLPDAQSYVLFVDLHMYTKYFLVFSGQR